MTRARRAPTTRKGDHERERVAQRGHVDSAFADFDSLSETSTDVTVVAGAPRRLEARSRFGGSVELWLDPTRPPPEAAVTP